MDRESGRQSRQGRRKGRWTGKPAREAKDRTGLRSDRKQEKIMDAVYQNAVNDTNWGLA